MPRPAFKIDWNLLPMTRRWVDILIVILLLTVCFQSSARAQANVQGQWNTLSTQMPINPVHVALMHTGKVLIVSGSGNFPSDTNYMAAVWDPATDTVTTQPVLWDMFCNGMIVLPDGRPLIMGGTLQYDPFHGQLKISAYDPATGNFVDLQPMAHGRWYPTATTLADGSLMIFSGLDENGNNNQAVEFYKVGSGWSQQYLAPFNPPLYPRMHLLPNGTVFNSGPQPGSAVFNPATQTWTTGVAFTNYSGTRTYGTSVLLPLTPANNYDPRVIIMGGGNPATATTEIIDLGATNLAWAYGPSMSQPRIEMDAVILPNGKVLAVNGSTDDEDSSTASLNADLYDPASNTFSSAGANAYPRLYHSGALLLPDATVLDLGGNPERGTYQPQMEIYSPAYLFNSDGSLATRPTITSVTPGVIGYGAGFQIQTPNAANISSVVLIRAGSPTHAFDMDQRLVGLSFTAGSGVLNATAPPNGSIAPPGYYLLFILNSSGVPSVAQFVQLSLTPTDQTPKGTITSPSGNVTIPSSQSVSFAGTGTSQSNSIASYSWVFPGGNPATSSLASPGAVTFSMPGTYVASLTVTDSLGSTDPSPPTRTITVTGVAPSITSASSTTFTVGTAGSFTVTTTGSPTPALTESGSLPNPVTFVDNGNGTATISGTPATGTAGSYPITITANNGVGAPATQSFTLTVHSGTAAPTITSANSATFAVGSAGTFTVTTTGSPTPTLTESGSLPSPLTFKDNGNGTATLSGTPASGTAGTYPITITANNGVGTAATQSFTLTVTAGSGGGIKLVQHTSVDAGITSSASLAFTVNNTLGNWVGVCIRVGQPNETITVKDSKGNTYHNATQINQTGDGDTLAIFYAENIAAGANTVTVSDSAADTLRFAILEYSGVATSGSIDGATANQGSNASPNSGSITTKANGDLLLGAVMTADPETFTAGSGFQIVESVPAAPNTKLIAEYQIQVLSGSTSSSATIGSSDPWAAAIAAFKAAGGGTSAPAITSANSTTFLVDAASNFTVTTTGSPTPALTESGALPNPVTFVDNGNGTATIAGTPSEESLGSFPITITASNGVGTAATQNFTLTVGQVPAITSANNTAFTVGTAGTFTVTTTGSPTPALTESGSLPSPVTFKDNGNGTATLSGAPASGTAGTYPITITAKNGVGTAATQTFTLTVAAGGTAPTITSANSASFVVGSAGSFTVTTTGSPTPALTESGSLPSPVTFKDNGNGTATLSGTPASGTAGTYPITITANNGVGTAATQTFTLTVNQAPAITSANNTTFTVGSAGSFTVTTTGKPTPALTESGSLPSPVTFKDNGNGTATLSGTPASGTAGTYPITITANNGVGTAATQSFTLTVTTGGTAPTITSANSATFTVGSAGSFIVTTTGSPTPALTESGSLPSPVTFKDNGNGTATIAGTPATGTAGSYQITIAANNSVGTAATQTFTLTVNQAPAITSANNTTFTVGSAGTFTVTTTGKPAPALTESGSLPSPVTFKDNGNGTATLSGTPASGTAGTYPITITANNGIGTAATQSFTLTVTSGGGGGIKLVQHTSVDAGITTSTSLAFPVNNTLGNWIGVCIRAGQPNETFTIKDSRGNTYHQATQINQSGDEDTLAIFYAENIAAGANTVTVSDSTQDTLRFAILEYSGVATSGSIDGATANQGSNASPNSGSVVTMTNGDLLLGAVMAADPETFTAGTGFQIVEGVPAEPNTKLIVEYQVQATAGSASATATLGSADPWAAGIAAFKP